MDATLVTQLIRFYSFQKIEESTIHSAVVGTEVEPPTVEEAEEIWRFVEMDPEVWKCLVDHEDILRLILYRVSWDTNLRLRSVSKAFYATLSDPSVLTWSSMLTDRSFYTDHSSLKWVHTFTRIDAEHLEQSHADAVCFFTRLQSTSEGVAYALVNFELHRWCTLPPLGDLPFGKFNDFKVTGVGEGLMLLERTEGMHGDDSVLDMYELDRFLFNPLTKWFIKLPGVPKKKGSSENHLRMIMAVEKEIVTVVAVGFHTFRRPKFPRLLIWHQGSQDWVQINTRQVPSPILPVDNTLFSLFKTNVVCVGGELFFHIETLEFLNSEMLVGERIFSFGSRERAIDLELIWTCNNIMDVKTHLFPHNGALKRVDLCRVTVVTAEEKVLYCTIDLYAFNCASRNWQKEESILMPWHLLESVSTSSQVAGVLGDILVIRNRDEPSVFILYNFQTKQWCRYYTKDLVQYANTSADSFHINFLWSPKRYDSRQIAPSVR
ncbi:hypothetical protein R1sor_003251 [Riccia sorocarpa]|uniref:F-box domain-containing protein n=1 Tax=Riccia sorocarpa TaxID=122646 RepID=A0ABD3H3W0_9MARC